ncbi:hypothetical protein QEG98_32600 [Myxococcus sp. MxC21-1]|nr:MULTISPECIES: hypothetical protein [Myxococcus]WAM30424.1 hypothetical protein OZ403_31185 [Myxococcus sp. NMCA1]WNZ66079.1 hypothetical protein QEG98_32600 [Myxococcus sp. MxC21-1]
MLPVWHPGRVLHPGRPYHPLLPPVPAGGRTPK